MREAHPGGNAEADATAPFAVLLRGVAAGFSRREPVLRGLDFDARPGEVSAVCGPAGSGKSTLIDVLRAALEPFEGEAEILGLNPIRLRGARRARLKRRMGFVAQRPLLLDHFTAFENVALPLRVAGAKSASFAVDIEELLRFLGMPDGDHRPAGALSGSERRRVAIARAVVGQPRLLLADEPTAGLAPELGTRVLRLLVSMRRAGAAVVVATQDEAVAAQLNGPQWRMQNGRCQPAQPAALEK